MLCVGRLLKAFEEASGLMVNFEKSSVAFSRNTSNDIRVELVNILGVCVVAKHEKYLGLPALMGHPKRDIFQDMKDKVWKRLQSWKCINLSQAGKLVLLKSVVQFMSTFVMGCFLIPTTLCLELRVRWLIFCGTIKNLGGCIRSLGINYARGKMKGVLVFEGWRHLTTLCWLNNYGELPLIRMPCLVVC
ncbi:UNVERIFIED_CONTAM: hypothetical protein Sradi_0882700 [Sesamum radiatum]|uniref:Uncharacterized protein n=1 Tax=Sesamum radiatum TaxID=300843 RepID=A0AAW2V3M0_SESRA